MGSAITAHFIVTMNFKDRELLLTPYSSNGPRQKERTFGFDLNREGDRIYVSKLYKGSVADRSGLQLEDTVISINGERFNDQGDYCMFYDRTREYLKGDEIVRLQVCRGQQTHSFELAKTELFVQD